MPIKVGIIGYGFAAKSFHLPFINALPNEYEVIAILQRAEAPSDPSSAAKGTHCTVDFPLIKHYRTADEFFKDGELEFVVVASHADTHIELAKRALSAGNHVIVDKPFARSTEEADGAVELAKEKGLVLTCFQNRRWVSDYLDDIGYDLEVWLMRW
jgi:predicted dehydrogenase